MNNNAVDYLNILLKIDLVKSHKTLSNQSKQIIYKEIRDQLPPEMLSTASLGTRKIILDILEDNIDEKSTTKSTSQKEKKSNKINDLIFYRIAVFCGFLWLTVLVLMLN